METKELLELKQEIVKSQEKVSQLKGRRSLLKETLNKKWGVKTIPEATKKVKGMKDKIDKMSTTISEDSEKLEKQLNEQNTTDTK